MQIQRYGYADVYSQYSAPENAEKFFFDLKWSSGFVCSKCDHTHCTKVVRKNGNLRSVYQCSHCGHQESVTAGTVLEGTKVPLFSWILVMFVYAISKTGTSAKYISDLTGVSYNTTKLMLRKIKQAQNEDNDSHVVTDCEVIELDVFTCGGAKHGKRGWDAAGKVKVAAAAVKRYVWDDEQENMDVFEATEGIWFRIVSSENKAELTCFLEETILSDCVVHCDKRSANLALDIEGKLMDAQKFESGSTHLSLLDHTISTFKSKVQGTTHGIALRFLENELADFEWKFNRRKQTKKQIFKSLGKTLVKGTHRTRTAMIDYFKSINESMGQSMAY